MDMDPRFIGVVPPGLERRTVSKYARKEHRAGPGRPKIPIRPGTGARIRAYIQEQYGSQMKAAEAWGCSRQYVSMVVLEQTPPSEKIREDVGL